MLQWGLLLSNLAFAIIKILLNLIKHFVLFLTEALISILGALSTRLPLITALGQ